MILTIIVQSNGYAVTTRHGNGFTRFHGIYSASELISRLKDTPDCSIEVR